MVGCDILDLECEEKVFKEFFSCRDFRGDQPSPDECKTEDKTGALGF
jgi:hypothetical protein